MKKSLSLIAVYLCCAVFMMGTSSLVFAQSTLKQYKQVTASGSARTSDKALTKALANAVSQVNGATVAQNMRIEETEDEIRLGLWGNTVVIPSKEINTGFTQSYSQGFVKSYQVTSTRFDSSSGDYTVTIDAMVHFVGDYQNIGQDRNNMIPMTVSLLKADSQSYEGLNGSEPATVVAERITTELTAQLTESDQFRLLDRRNLPKALSEDLITKSLGAKTGQQVKFDQKLSADLFLAGSIRQFDVASRRVKSYGTAFDNYEAELVLDIRVIETATGEVRFAKRFEQYLNHDQIKNELDKYQVNIFELSEFYFNQC